ncbi:MAG TPA: cyclic nucleotide-binding domain-containing protein [Thermoleophilia bacterium]|nr:cyclic nucleotide-binding domain-containing protein [Thermoleophilia bacterium]
MRPPTADLSVETTLRHCDLLEPLSDGQIAELAARATRRTLQEGEKLFSQNDEARDLCIIESGRLAVRLAAPGGHVIEVFDAGQYRLSGWSALVAPHIYIADATALEYTSVLLIPAGQAEEVFLTEPERGYAVMKKLAGTISMCLRDIKEQLIELLER